MVGRPAPCGGVVASLAGLLAPSAVVTTILAAEFARLGRYPLFQAGLKGVVLATAGAYLVNAWRLIRPALVTARREGRLPLVMAATVCAGAPLGLLLLQMPVYALLAGAGVLTGGAVWLEDWSRRSR